VHAHRVVLRVSATILGAIDAAPAARDALHAALSTAIATSRGEALADLDLVWSRAPVAHPYRGRVDHARPDLPFQEGVLDYARGAGDEELARALEHGTIEWDAERGAFRSRHGTLSLALRVRLDAAFAALRPR
jgi:hypothetical protein